MMLQEKFNLENIGVHSVNFLALTGAHYTNLELYKHWFIKLGAEQRPSKIYLIDSTCATYL